MKHPTQNGFVLILAVVGIALAAAALYILAGLAANLLFDANQAYLEAYNRNLSSSALAWAQQNRQDLSDSALTDEIRLDIEQLMIPDGDLRITPLAPREKSLRLQITTECRRETMKLERSDAYLIKPR